MISGLLDKHLERVSGTLKEPGTCRYLNGLDDEQIAEAVRTEMPHESLPLPVSAVTALRIALYGDLAKPEPHDPAADLSEFALRVHRLLGDIDQKIAAANNRIDLFSSEQRDVLIQLNNLIQRVAVLELRGE